MPSNHFNLQKYIKKKKYKTILIKISYFCSMKERINWIDWAKALAVCGIVFIHLPQSQECFYFRYFQADILVIFFFISGYLKKDRGSNKENWKKYWNGLIIPYLLYNAIIYPYWLVKHYMLNDGMPDLYTAFKPIWGALLFEHENSFCEPLNGPMWYLPTILIMHTTIDFCRRTKHQHLIMITLCILSFILYAANKYWYFAPNLTPMGLMRNLPYYYIGYVSGQYHLYRDIKPNRDIIYCIICLSGSLLFFHWHLQAYFGGQHLLHIILFYPVNIGFLLGVLYGCKKLDSIKLSFIINLSTGTLVVVGLHSPVVSLINLIIEYILHIDGTICYHWYEALPINIFIVVLLYPIILFAKQFAPIFLGKYNKRNEKV